MSASKTSSLLTLSLTTAGSAIVSCGLIAWRIYKEYYFVLDLLCVALILLLLAADCFTIIYMHFASDFIPVKTFIRIMSISLATITSAFGLLAADKKDESAATNEAKIKETVLLSVITFNLIFVYQQFKIINYYKNNKAALLV